MNERIPVALYPYRKAYYPLVKHFEEFQEKYTLAALISPDGFGLTGKDAGYAVGQDTIGLIVQSELDVTEDWMTLFVVEPQETEEVLQEKCRDYIRQSVDAGKTVIYFCADRQYFWEELKQLSDVTAAHLTFQVASGMLYQKVETEIYHFKEENLKNPIMLFGGLIQEETVTENMLLFAQQLRGQGLKCVLIANEPGYQLFDAYSIRYILRDPELNQDEKVQRINWLIRDIEIAEAPDVILLEASDALMSFDDYASNGYGIHTYMTCLAHQPDYLISSLPCDLFQTPLIERISSRLRERLGCEITAAGISNGIVDTMEVTQKRKVSMVRADQEMVEQYYNSCQKDCSIPVFRPQNTDVARICIMLTEEGE